MNSSRFTLIAAILMLIFGSFVVTASAQKTTKHKKHARVSYDEAPLRAEPDPRSRRTPSTDRDRRRGNSSSVFTPRMMTSGDEIQDGENRRPTEIKLTKAGSFDGDLSRVKYTKPKKMERPEREEPVIVPVPYGQPTITDEKTKVDGSTPSEDMEATDNFAPSAPAPAPNNTFDGLDFATFGGGHPPDTNGDVGPNNYIQTINTSIGIYNKTTGARQVGMTFNTFMSQGTFGNLCDTNNFGDPVVLYDSFEDRWVITDFAFTLDGSGNVNSNSYQCFAVSKTGDPVAGGWNFYYTVQTDYLGDYPKFGVWTDGIYWAANMFGKSAGGSFANARVFAMNKAQMYAGAPTVQVITIDAPSSEFTLLPANARLQTGTPPAGSPNYFLTGGSFLNALNVYKFHVDWDRISLSSLTGPSTPITTLWWEQYLNSGTTTIPSPSNRLDSLYPRLMMQNEYTNIAGVESIWASHTVGAGNPTTNLTSTQAAVRYYQIKVTGGSVEPTATQAYTYSPDATLFRFMPSTALNRNGDMALGYSTANATTNPGMKYAGRLAADPVNTITLTEQLMYQGTGSQSGLCGGTCTRWGDYSAMTLDPDGCTFWYTNMYYSTTGLNFLTRIGNFNFSGCSALANNGSLAGVVTSSVTGLPISGATVSFGNRTVTANAGGNYSFTNIPQGTYPKETAAATGYNTATSSPLVVTDTLTTTQNFALDTATTGGCATDTTQSDFQLGVATNVDLATSAGNAILLRGTVQDQQNATLGTSGVGITTSTYGGQTFTPALTGNLTKVDLNLFCSGCTGTTPNLTLSIRATSSNLPTGSDIASGTITGFSNGGIASYFTVTFASPPTLSAGTQYAILIRPTSNPSIGTYALTRSGTSTTGSDVYSGGTRVSGATSGTVWSIPTTGGITTDAGFTTYMDAGYKTSGNLVSGLKDSNPVSAGTTQWASIAWTASLPTNTTVKFQAAASNSQYGPFNFVGPDSTNGTYFSSGGSLSQFNGFRYLKYIAYLSTTNTAATPTVNDVTICYTTPRVWTGAVSSDWNNPGNWSSGGLPGSSDAAIIPAAGVTNNPTNTSSVSVASLSLGSGRIVDTGSNTLTVNTCSPSAITGGSSTSYVKGSLTRCVDPSGTYLFPVGTTLGYSPTSLSGITGTGNFSVTPVEAYIPGVQTTTSPKRYWTLTPISGVTSANISLTYLDADLPPSPPEASYVIIRNSGGNNGSYTPTTINTATNTFTLNGVSAFSDWTVGILAPTAAGVTVSGRVLTSSGQGLRNAVVTISDQAGHTRSAITSAFGYYSFSDVEVGQSYTVSVSSKRFTFATRLVNLNDAVDGLDFTAQ